MTELLTPEGPGDIEASFDYLLEGREEARAAARTAEAERDEARHVALLCRGMLASMPVFLDELFGEDEWERLPDWFKDGDASA